MLRFMSTKMLSTWKKIQTCDVLLSCNDGDRSYMYKNKRYSPLIDSFSEYCKSSGLKTSSISDDITQYVSDKSYNSPGIVNRTLFAIKVFVKVAKLIGLSEKKASDLRLKFEVEMWREVLSIAKPKLVVGIQPVVPLCIACNEQLIPIYDLQHGIITGDHDNRYYSSARLSLCKENYLPSGFLLWDENAEKNIRSIAALKIRDTIILGNPWYTRFLDPEISDDLVDAELILIPELSKSLPTIIVTLQYHLDEYAPDYVPDGIMTESLRTAICNTDNLYHWLIRLHPNQMFGSEKRRVYSYLEGHFDHLENVHWKWCSTVALPALLSTCKLHITHFSATTIEAAMMNIPTILLDPHICSNGKHQRFYQYEREIGLAYVTPLKKKVLEASIVKILARKVQEKKHSFCKNNMLKFINEIKSIEND